MVGKPKRSCVDMSRVRSFSGMYMYFVNSLVSHSIFSTTAMDYKHISAVWCILPFVRDHLISFSMVYGYPFVAYVQTIASFVLLSPSICMVYSCTYERNRLALNNFAWLPLAVGTVPPVSTTPPSLHPLLADES